MVKAIFALFIISLSPAWADAAIESYTQPSDASVAYLSMIFGVVDGVLQGGGSQIAGHLSSRLSTMLLLTAGILWTYTTFVGILNTASEGQFLGQKWSSMWVPVRTVIGFVLLMPKGTTGYSLIQVIVMSIVLQGVNAANAAWHTTLNYLEERGAIVEPVRWFMREDKSKQATTNPQVQPIHLDYATFIEKAGEVLKAEVCMMTKYYTEEQKSRAAGQIPPFMNFANILDPTEGKSQIQFPGYCGVLQWKRNPISYRLPGQVAPSDFLKVSMHRMALDLLTPAQHIARTIASCEKELPDNFDFRKGLKGSLIGISEGVMGLLKSQYRPLAQVKDALKAAKFDAKKEDMRQAGWIVAGNYYSVLAKTNRAIADIAPDFSQVSSSISLENFDQKKVLSELSGAQRKNLERFLDKGIDEFIQDEKEGIEEYYSRRPWITHKPDANVTALPNTPFGGSVETIHRYMRNILDTEKDPILAFSKIGANIFETMEKFWHDSKLNLGLNGAIVGVWMVLNFTIGATLIYYIPLIPFLLFFFGSLTWLTLVIGAVLAAPLVALGLMHPEGHDFFGQAEQATRLLAALFLRPMLMIFGLVFGMILCTVIFELFHYGYEMVMPDIYHKGGILAGVSQVAILALYTTIAISIVTRCFSLIYELPNRAFSWIGWQTEGHSEAEILSQARGSVDQQMGSIGQVIRSPNSSNNAPHAPNASQVTIQDGS